MTLTLVPADATPPDDAQPTLAELEAETARLDEAIAKLGATYSEPRAMIIVQAVQWLIERGVLASDDLELAVATVRRDRLRLTLKEVEAAPKPITRHTRRKAKR